MRRIRESVEAGREVSAYLLNYRKDGSPFWCYLYVAPLFDGDGTLTSFIGVQACVTLMGNILRTPAPLQGVGHLSAFTAVVGGAGAGALVPYKRSSRHDEGGTGASGGASGGGTSDPAAYTSGNGGAPDQGSSSGAAGQLVTTVATHRIRSSRHEQASSPYAVAAAAHAAATCTSATR